MQMKKCRKCGRLLPLTEKYWTHNKRFGCGFESRCKECSRPDRLYRKWIDMKSRCLNPNSCNYKHYGGRGIVICDEWLGNEGFENFCSRAIVRGYSENLLEAVRMRNTYILIHGLENELNEVVDV